MRNRAILMLGLAVVFAIVAAFLAQSWLRGQVGTPVEQTVIVQEAPKPPETTIVVARQPLFYGNELTRQNVREIPWLANDLPDGTFQKIDDLFVDDQPRIVLRTMEQNEPVLNSKISGNNLAATMSAIVPIGMRAITFGSNEIAGVAGHIIPNDRVDMILSRETGVSIFIQNVQILSVAQQVAEEPHEPRVVRSYTIAVTPSQVPKIILAYSVGAITLALRNRGDADITRATRATVADLGIGEAFRPAGTNVAGSKSKSVATASGSGSVVGTSRRRGPTVNVTRGLSVFKYEVKREAFEPLAPTQLAPTQLAPSASAANGGGGSTAAAAEPAADAPAEPPAPLLPPDRVNF